MESNFNFSITGLSLNTRTLSPGNVFFALAGENQHGFHYAQQAVAKGAAAIVYDSIDSAYARELGIGTDIPAVAIHDLRQHMGAIAKRFYDDPSSKMRVVAITGTDGKTSVSHFVAQMLTYLSRPCGVIGTLGNGIFGALSSASQTTPDTLQLHALMHDMLDQDAQFVAMEASSHGLAQDRLNGISIDTAVFTNLTQDHLDYHNSLDAYINAKKTLFTDYAIRRAVVNIDDPIGQEIYAALPRSITKLAYSAQTPSAGHDSLLHVHHLHPVSNGFHLEIVSPFGKGMAQLPLLCTFNVSNALAALGVLLLLEIPFERALEAFSHLQTVTGRAQVLPRYHNKPHVVIDYAHTPAALQHILMGVHQHFQAAIWCVFGCGGNRDRTKRSLMARAVEKYADYAIVTDDNPRFEDPETITNEIVSGFSKNFSFRIIHDRADAIKHAIKHAKSNDVVIIAGKGHENIQQIKGQNFPFSDTNVATTFLEQ